MAPTKNIAARKKKTLRLAERMKRSKRGELVPYFSGNLDELYEKLKDYRGIDARFVVTKVPISKENGTKFNTAAKTEVKQEVESDSSDMSLVTLDSEPETEDEDAE